MNIIKEFIEFKRFYKIYKEIDLTEETKNKLKALGKDKIYEELITKIKVHLTGKILSGELKSDEVKGALYTLNYIRGLIK